MIHLISTNNIPSKGYQLKEQDIGTFRTTLRGTVGGSVFVVSTFFKTDIFYQSDKRKENEILKLWKLYLKNDSILDSGHISSHAGVGLVFNHYFDSLTLLSRNQLKYKSYLKAFRKAYQINPSNELALKLIECDRMVIGSHESQGLHKREELLPIDEEILPPPSDQVPHLKSTFLNNYVEN